MRFRPRLIETERAGTKRGRAPLLCDDPLVDQLRGYGYNVIRLPSASFMPLLLLESDGRNKLRAIGRLEAELPPRGRQTVPHIREDVAVADLALASSRQHEGRV